MRDCGLGTDSSSSMSASPLSFAKVIGHSALLFIRMMHQPTCIEDCLVVTTYCSDEHVVIPWYTLVAGLVEG